jgi:hypothetical protein
MEVMIRKKNKGQVALILVLAATVAGTLVISLAERSTRDLRTQSLDTEKVKALKGAESGVEQALLDGASVNNYDLGGGVSFSANYSDEGGNGMVSELVESGDVLDVLVEGADAGVTGVKVYFSSESLPAALKVSEYKFSGGVYSVNSYAYDNDGDRALVNKFSTSSGGGTFNGVVFGSSAVVSVDPLTTKLLRITVLYSASKVGVSPVGGNLPGQQVVISSVGSYSVSGDASVKKRLELKKEMDKVPVMFDKVLYSNSKLIQ